MTSQVYYRKWRPRRFDQLVGQEHVARTLRQAVSQDRVAHAYLFCGPRGTGKTTTARILSKVINCLQPQNGEPCDVCAPCLAINEGRFMDLIELDAASNRGIDDIRSIREKVNFTPAEGKYKSYIIDEAHMLTPDASNAFLKTLEEPPAHVIFILCTTDPQKLLPTILSRCQRFDFKRLSLEEMVGRLRMICQQEGLTVEEEALKVLARTASGSLRDAENLLEQLVVSYGPQAGAREANELLGDTATGHQVSLEVVRHTLLENAPAALAAINRGLWEGVDLRQLHRQTIELMRGVLLLQCGNRDTVELPAETVRELEPLASKVPLQRVVHALKLLGEVNLRYDAPSPLPLELAVVEVSLKESPAAEKLPASTQVASAPTGAAYRGSPRKQETSIAKEPPIPPKLQRVRPDPVPAANPSPSSATPVADSKPSNEPVHNQPGEFSQSQWDTLVKALSRHKGNRFNIGALLRDCKLPYVEDNTLVLKFSHRSHLERMQQEMENPQSRRTVEEVMVKAIGNAYQLKLTLEGENGANNGPVSTRSPLVRTALSMGARILEEKESHE